MFQDCNFNAVSFKSDAKQVSRSVDADTQTCSLSNQDASGQTIELTSKLVQTDESKPEAIAQFDAENVAEFLNEKYPMAAKELDNPMPSMEGVEDVGDSFSQKCKKLYEIKGPAAAEKKVRVSASVWKKDSGMLCLGYSYEHEGWCTHTSSVQVFNLNLINCSHEVTPKVFQTPSCITCLDHHPSLPNILAGALFSGVVSIWDLNKEEIVCTTSANHTKPSQGHKDIISQLSWIRNFDITKDQPMLVTSGSDGFIILWQYSSSPGDLTMLARFMIQPPFDNARKGFPTFQVEYGVSAFCFSPHDPTTFIVGLEGGDIMKCGITDICIKEGLRDMHIYEMCPNVGNYEQHISSVTAIKYLKCAPNGSARFITSGIDKVIRIFDEKQDVPISRLHCEEEIMGLMFCNEEEKILLAWGSLKVHFFDANTLALLEAPVLGNEIHNTSVCSNERSVIAVGNSHGIAAIWEISEIMKRE